MRSLIQATPAYELRADISATTHGYDFRFITFVPTARRPEEHMKFQGLFSAAELAALRELIAAVLERQREAAR